MIEGSLKRKTFSIIYTFQIKLPHHICLAITTQGSRLFQRKNVHSSARKPVVMLNFSPAVRWIWHRDEYITLEVTWYISLSRDWLSSFRFLFPIYNLPGEPSLLSWGIFCSFLCIHDTISHCKSRGRSHTKSCFSVPGKKDPFGFRAKWLECNHTLQIQNFKLKL